jgi:tRNA synthetases class I (R)
MPPTSALAQGKEHLQTVKLVDLLDEARDRCLATITERRADAAAKAAASGAANGASGGTAEPVDGEVDAEKAAAIMGYGAVKYADLKNQRLTNYKFSMDEMLNMKARGRCCPGARAQLLSTPLHAQHDGTRVPFTLACDHWVQCRATQRCTCCTRTRASRASSARAAKMWAAW